MRKRTGVVVTKAQRSWLFVTFVVGETEFAEVFKFIVLA
jgi:hypothetical protein